MVDELLHSRPITFMDRLHQQAKVSASGEVFRIVVDHQCFEFIGNLVDTLVNHGHGIHVQRIHFAMEFQADHAISDVP